MTNGELIDTSFEFVDEIGYKVREQIKQLVRSGTLPIANLTSEEHGYMLARKIVGHALANVTAQFLAVTKQHEEMDRNL